MAIFKRKNRAAPDSGPPPRAVLAAAVPLSGPEATRYAASRQTQNTEQWQKDAWYYYDAVGELRAPVNWIANAVSKADLFGAETDPETGLVTGPTEDLRAQRAAALCLGGVAKRAQLQYLLAVCWQVPGEAFVVVRGRPEVRSVPQPDEWLVLSAQKVKVKGKSQWVYTDPVTLREVELGPRDRLIRVWSPHPNDQSRADSAVRPALPVLREIEKASMNLSAVLDSRISSNGIHAIPQEINLPRAEGESNAEALSDMLLRATSAGIEAPGTAAAQVPVIVEIPEDYIDAFVRGRMYPDTSMDQTVITLRESDLSRLAATLDMPNETAEGSTGGMNHWGAWQVEETTYKIYIEPLLDRFGDAVTEFWYRPALAAMGVEKPENHTLAWDTTGIVARPDSTEDMNWLHDNGLISDDYRRQASGVPEDAAPDDEETQLRRLERIVIGAPTLAADPEIGRRLFGFEVAPAAAGVNPEEAGASAGEEVTTSTPARSLPAAPESTDEVPDGLVAAAELIVFDALSRAGGRLLTREHRGQFSSTPKHELHTVISCTADDHTRLLNDSFLWADRVAATFGADPEKLRDGLYAYTRRLIRDGLPHDLSRMREYVEWAAKK